MKDVIILGSTGSIGKQALDVARKYSLRVVGLCCEKNSAELSTQIRLFHPKYAAVRDRDAAAEIAREFPALVLFVGEEGAARLAAVPCDAVLNALVGISGLVPTLKAIEAGNDVALANKETLVSGGELVLAKAKEAGVKILPVDSEHSAIWQCLDFDTEKPFEKLILTASGGAFRGSKRAELVSVKAREALKHPTWSMGAKVTIDSATMMNKGLEIVEAMRLFNTTQDKIDVVIHPQSTVHSAVRFAGGGIMAQLSFPDMRLPIQYALLYPDKPSATFSELSFDNLTLSFAKPDLDTFPCLGIARECAAKTGNYCCVMNAANEAAVGEYARDKIGFYDIPYYISKALDALGDSRVFGDVEEILRCDAETRRFVTEEMKSK